MQEREESADLFSVAETLTFVASLPDVGFAVSHDSIPESCQGVDCALTFRVCAVVGAASKDKELVSRYRYLAFGDN